MTNPDTLAGGVKLEDRESAITAAAQAFCNRGITIACPWEGDLDDEERERFDALVAAIDAYNGTIALAALPATGAVKAEPRSEAELEALPAHPLAKWRGGLDLGIHRVFWKVGGSSLVAIGMSTDGRRWFAPCNWVAPSTDPEAYFWDDIERTELLHAYPDRAPSGGEPEPVPVAWRWKALGHEDAPWITVHDGGTAAAAMALFASKDMPHRVEPLFPSPPKPSEAMVATHRHVKRGTEYVLLGYGKMQAERWVDGKTIAPRYELDKLVIESDFVDMREVAIYRSVDDGSLWVRPREEFEDGRFIVLTAALSGGAK